MKILVVEDTEDSRVLLVDQLQLHGYDVDAAENGHVLACAGVERAAHDGRTRVAADQPERGACFPAAAESIDAAGREDVGLVEVEQAPGLALPILSFAARQRVRT